MLYYILLNGFYMRVAQIIHGVSNSSAGSTYFVGHLADALKNMGNDSSIISFGEQPQVWPYQAPITVYASMLEKRMGFSPSLLRDVMKQSSQSGILHGHGIWRMTNLFPLLLNEKSQAKIVLSTHGAIAPWSMRYKSVLKTPFWKALQKPALKRSHCFHVTSSSEYEDVRHLGLRGPVAIIPIGIGIPDLPNDISRQNKIVFLGRIDPVKGLDILIPAWTRVAERFPAWELVIAGPLDNDYANTMQALARRLNTPRIQFLGQVLGEAKQVLLSEATLFVLPSYSENFGIVVAEALAYGVPVIASTETPWHDLEQRKCGWLIPPTQDALERVLQEALRQQSPALKNMGLRGREWMQESYAWSSVADMMQQTYAWLLQGGRKPDWVEVE